MISPRPLTRLIPVVLLLCLPFSLPLRGQAPADDGLRRARGQFDTAYREKDWPRTVEAGLKTVELSPNESVFQYNLACVYALSGDANEALKWLGKAAENGFSRVRLLEADTDLDTVRGHEAYRTALDAVKANLKREREDLKRKFEERPPLVFLPAGRHMNEPRPLIIALHGYGDWSRAIAEQWREAAGQIGAILVAPQGVRPVAGAGFSWGGIDEAESLVQLTRESMAKGYKIDERRVVLTGFSQGGFVAYSVGVRYPKMYNGVIPIGPPYIPGVDAPAKVSGEGLPRFYFMVGERDELGAQCRQAAKDFAAAGYETKLVVYPGVGHAFPLDRDQELRRALKFVLNEASWGAWDAGLDDSP